MVDNRIAVVIMNMSLMFFSVFTLFLLTGCGSGGSGEGANTVAADSELKGSDETEKNDASPTASKIGTKNFSDFSGDAAFAFIDLEAARLTMNDTSITVSMTLLSLAGPFTVNNPNVLEDYLEYEWAVLFGESQRVKLSLSQFNGSYFPDETADNILDFVQYDLWIPNGDFNEAAAKPDVTVDGNVISISVERSAHSVLEDITMDTKVTFRARHRVGGVFDIYEDEMN